MPDPMEKYDLSVEQYTNRRLSKIISKKTIILSQIWFLITRFKVGLLVVLIWYQGYVFIFNYQDFFL